MYKWNYLPFNPELSVLQNLLQSRNLSLEQLSSPQLYHPFLIHDSKQAATQILQAVNLGKKIFIHGDYDVDGVCATAIVWDYIYRKLNYKSVTPFIPSRFDEGYGLSNESIGQMVNDGAELVISVDCGVKDIQLVAEWQAKGIDFIITDHHTLATIDNVPTVSTQALSVVHPKHPVRPAPFTEICGAAVAWKLCCATEEVRLELNTNLDQDYSLSSSFTAMQEYLDLVSLATVCDVMPLVQENRAIVIRGLQQFATSKRPGIKALAQLANIDLKQISVYHYGYVIGPRLNAAGRLASAITALKLLTTESEENANKIALQLDALNKQRQDLSKQYLQLAQIQAQAQVNSPITFVFGQDWPEGIIGLVAGKLAEEYFKPTFVASVSNGVAVGSSRSPNGFHLANGLKQASSLLTKYGGHAQAAGFSLLESNLNELNQNLISQQNSNTNTASQRELNIDAVLNPEQLNTKTWEQIQQLNPFGNSNTEPIIALHNVTLKSVRKFGKSSEHSGLILQHDLGTIEAVAFNYQTNIPAGSSVNVAGTLNLNTWGGSSKIEIGFKDILQN